MTPPTTEDGELVKLNLVMTYPVQWSRFRVLRDFLQNFFDSVPNEEFASRLAIRPFPKGVEISVNDVAFSHEWLVPIGASTKTANGEGEFAGYFGEGFKVAALCAVRDFAWKISVGSDHWRLDVTTAPFLVDGVAMNTLAYRVIQLAQPSPATWIRLEGLHREDLSLLETAVLWSFYYPENPLLGEVVWADQRTAVWTRSKIPLPRGYPGSSAGKGVLFIGRQARGTHELPFVLAAHDVRDGDRERSVYYKFKIVDSIARIAFRLPPGPSIPLLQATSRHWAEYRKRPYECGSWEPVVRLLVKNLAKDPATTARWREQHPRLLVLEPLPRGNMEARNRRSEALSWTRTTSEQWRLVQNAFSGLGYPTLEEECEAQGGFLRRAQPSPEDRRRLELLLAFVRGHLLDLIPVDRLPPITLVHATRAGWRGYAVCHPLRDGPVSSGGRRVHYTVSEVALSSETVRSGTPQRALATLLHELCHAFGGDRSRRFGDALTDVLERLVVLPTELQALAANWAAPPD